MKYTSILFSLLCLLIHAQGQSQISILFVDDSDDTFGNTELFFNSFEAAEYPADYYNAVDSSQSPSYETMKAYDVVVWHSSTQSANLAFWQKTNEDNQEIIQFLENGGKMWLVGNDFLFGRYGGAQIEFTEGDFPYDYLGVDTYVMQTYVDDGNLGVPSVYPDINATIANLSELTWAFSTLWYSDGITINENASPIYRMGDENYPYYQTITGSLFGNDTFQVLSYFFDLALVTNTGMIEENIKAVMDDFSNRILDNNDQKVYNEDIHLYPNPATDYIYLDFQSKSNTIERVELLTLSGEVIQEWIDFSKIKNDNHEIQLPIPANVPMGQYYIMIETEGFHTFKSIIVH